MSTLDQPERVTQDRVIDLFCNELDYDYLEDDLLTAYLTECGYTYPQPVRREDWSY